MKKIFIYQITIILVVVIGWIQITLETFPHWLQEYKLPIQCVLLSTIGGVMYCLRAVYIERCVKNRWNNNWEVWYFIRPITSAISGLVAYIFLKAGLLTLEAKLLTEANNFGFLSLSFIAGFNVSNFFKKIENIANSTFGINNSNSSKDN